MNVAEFKYLGALINENGRDLEEIGSRLLVLFFREFFPFFFSILFFSIYFSIIIVAIDIRQGLDVFSRKYCSQNISGSDDSR